jgi:hypothetical protein
MISWRRMTVWTRFDMQQAFCRSASDEAALSRKKRRAIKDEAELART